MAELMMSGVDRDGEAEAAGGGPSRAASEPRGAPKKLAVPQVFQSSGSSRRRSSSPPHRHLKVPEVFQAAPRSKRPHLRAAASVPRAFQSATSRSSSPEPPPETLPNLQTQDHSRGSSPAPNGNLPRQRLVALRQHYADAAPAVTVTVTGSPTVSPTGAYRSEPRASPSRDRDISVEVSEKPVKAFVSPRLIVQERLKQM